MSSLDPQQAALAAGILPTPMSAASNPLGNGAPVVTQSTQAAGKEEFLKLLVAQIRNQDPMEPMGDKDMIAQLAQFTGIEQAMETNRQLTALQGMSSTQGRTGMAALIGKKIDADAAHIHWQKQSAESTTFVYDLQNPAEKVVVTVHDSQGMPVRSIQQRGDLTGAAQAAIWDGKDDSGRDVVDGDYTVTVTAMRTDGSQELAPRLRGTANGVGFDENGAAVLVGNVRVRPQQLTQIAQ